jgi:tetrapyrrole methylase family protein/MazG family protein
MEAPLINNLSSLNELLAIINTLRGEHGCPWDKKQTPETMTVYLIEEMYELIDAIASKKPDHIVEELGDVLFLIFFILSCFEEKGIFNISDVARISAEKMTRRHPHVFGNKTADSVDEVKKRWHKIKMEEKSADPKKSTLDAVPSALPALIRAYRISERAARVGFDWKNISDVVKKAEEEWDEFKTELSANHSEKTPNANVSTEFGDTLFTLVNVARFAHIHPETALTNAINKFKDRFEHMEKSIDKQGLSMESLSHDQFDALWNTAKDNILTNK